MSIEGQRFSYPGAVATSRQVLGLAEEYRRAAHVLRPTGRSGRPLSRAPYRLVAIHSLELHLNALLLASGHPPAKVRGLQHDIATRTDLAIAAGLKLRKRTILHLRGLSETREYLITRYNPELSAAFELTRLAATLEEVAEKVTTLINQRELGS
jgi:hypothetical protein